MDWIGALLIGGIVFAVWRLAKKTGRRRSVETATRTWWTKTARIKEQYPNPQRGTGPMGTYCVGGAFMKYHNLNGGFPDAVKLRDGLTKVNPNLPRDRAFAYASEIILLNDHGNFCEAWDVLERALTY